MLPDLSQADPVFLANAFGMPWRSNVGFRGLAYCVEGRSLYWGGWSRGDRRRSQELPADLQTYLKANYNDTEKETGVDPATDFISGDLYDALKKAMTRPRRKWRRSMVSKLRHSPSRLRPRWVFFRSTNTAARPFSQTPSVRPRRSGFHAEVFPRPARTWSSSQQQ